MKKWTIKDICKAVLLAGYIVLFWYVASYFPVAFDWAASWIYKITGSKTAIIILGSLLLMVFCAIYAFAKIQGEFFGPIKKKEKDDKG
jgi:hypothetical protein